MKEALSSSHRCLDTLYISFSCERNTGFGEERGQKGNSEIGPLQAVRSMGCLLVHVCAVYVEDKKKVLSYRYTFIGCAHFKYIFPYIWALFFFSSLLISFCVYRVLLGKMQHVS